MRRRTLLLNGAICLVSLLVFCGVGEIAVRIYTRLYPVYDVEMARYAKEIKETAANPRIAHRHRPSSSAHLMGVDVHINSDGLRDREYAVERSPSYRMVFLGDSLTFGWGVAKPDTFEELLESEINRRLPVEILNFGVGNYNTEQEVHLFIDKGLKYKPDKVVVFWFVNDAEPTPGGSEWSVAQHSELVSFTWSRARRLMNKLGLSAPYTTYYRSLYQPDAAGWRAAREALLLLKQLCDGGGIELQVVLLPELHDLDSYPFAEEHATMASFLRANGIAHRDLLPNFQGAHDPKRLWVAPDDAHPNAIVHRRIARHALDFILAVER
ncbi:MAG: SGNH/GDSL hydrolase family protein [Deltaproteobacteria bacterium]|nr:SGNH/GDSL hydrolase family protein [Deltaproteobacteria bacterium]